MNTQLAIAIKDARSALEKLQKEIAAEVRTGQQEAATNDLLVRASQNHINHAQIAVDRIGNHLVRKLNTKIDQASREV